MALKLVLLQRLAGLLTRLVTSQVILHNLAAAFALRPEDFPHVRFAKSEPHRRLSSSCMMISLQRDGR